MTRKQKMDYLGAGRKPAEAEKGNRRRSWTLNMGRASDIHTQRAAVKHHLI